MSDPTRLRLVHAAPIVAVNEQAGRELLGGPAEENHIVQFYEDDVFLCDTVAHFLGAGLIRGEPIVVFATAAHRAALRERLLENAFDVDRACASGQVTCGRLYARSAMTTGIFFWHAAGFSRVGTVIVNARGINVKGR